MAEEFLDEASSLSLEDKMDMWHNGTRGFNVPACGEPKLIAAHKICTKKGYTKEASILADEANKRGIQLGQPAVKQQPDYKTNFLNLPNTITIADFTKDDLKAIRDNDQDHIFIRSTGVDGCLKEVLIKLIYAMLLKQNDVILQIKDNICKIAGISESELRDVITKIIADKNILNKITENVNSIDESLNEGIEKHNELNPKLWNKDNTLKAEVKEKIMQIVDDFCKSLSEDEIKFNLKDVKLVGSNCSYNYNKDSDLDVHLVFDLDIYNDDEKQSMAELIYDYARKLWNSNRTIYFYDIPVELYVETNNTKQLN